MRGGRLIAHRERRAADLGEAPELADQDARRLRERCLRRGRRIGLDLEAELVVVGHLADARVLHAEVHAAHGREDRVDRDDPDRHVLGVLGRLVAHTGLDGEVHLDRPLVGVEGEENEVGIDDLDVRGLGDVGGGDGAGAMLHQLEGDRVPRERAQTQLLDIQDDLGDVLLDVLDRAELVVYAGQLDRRHRRSLEGAEEDAPQRVAERHPVSGLERVDLEPAQVAGRLDLLYARSGLRGL
jgi:hypothetical protein